MIKRRFYRLEHGDKDAPSESSSSDSDEEPQATDETELEEEEEDETDEELADTRIKEEASLSSGYESENSTANEVNLDSSGLPTSDDEVAAQNGKQNIIESSSGGTVPTIARHSSEQDTINIDETDCVVKCKSVFKCRLCPRIVCLSEDTLKAHLNSKRHARSVKLLKEGRLKLFLNDDGKLDCENDPESQPLRNVSDDDEESTKSTKKGKGKRRQRKRQRMDTKPEKRKHSKENRAMRRRRQID